MQNYSKPVLSGHSKRRPKKGFQDRLSLNVGQMYRIILQYFRPSLSYHLSLKSFILFLIGLLRHVGLLLWDSVVVNLLFIVTPIVGVCNCSRFCFTLLYVQSSFAIILMEKRQLVALLCLPGIS